MRALAFISIQVVPYNYIGGNYFITMWLNFFALLSESMCGMQRRFMQGQVDLFIYTTCQKVIFVDNDN